MTIVSMPETTMHEDRGMKPANDDVGLTSQVLPVDSEAITAPVEAAADQEFRLRVLSPDSRHVAASGHGIMNVRHTPGQPTR